jgi:mycofactocin precursor
VAPTLSRPGPIVDLEDQDLQEWPGISPRYTAPVPDTTTATAERPAELPAEEAELVEDELLIEEISIDGMCGVY